MCLTRAYEHQLPSIQPIEFDGHAQTIEESIFDVRKLLDGKGQTMFCRMSPRHFSDLARSGVHRFERCEVNGIWSISFASKKEPNMSIFAIPDPTISAAAEAVFSVGPRTARVFLCEPINV